MRRAAPTVPSAATVNTSVTQGRAGQRIDCLSRNRDAILAYLADVRGPAGPRV